MDNYPHLLARTRALRLTDVTCSGATARQVLVGGQFRQPPQVDALRADTRLVTVTVGGNDVSYIGNLLVWSRRDAPRQTPLLWRLVLSKPTPDVEVDRALAKLPTLLSRIADEVRRRSPNATLVFVDYATVLPETWPDSGRLPLTLEHMQRGRSVAQRLAEITAEVAHQTGALLVRASEVTRGHDVCSADPWVFGYVLPVTPFRFAPIAYHPNARGMRAVADEIDAALPLFEGGPDEGESRSGEFSKDGDRGQDAWRGDHLIGRGGA
jgi:lysophospholipase L1-like esterase